VDVYALGCVLYWLLTGQLVFQGKSPGRLMHLHIQAPPAPPSERSELPIPPALDALVLSCLAKNADDRPADGNELRERLSALGLAEQWTRARAQHWWDTHRPQSMDLSGRCDGERLVPALPSN